MTEYQWWKMDRVTDAHAIAARSAASVPAAALAALVLATAPGVLSGSASSAAEPAESQQVVVEKPDGSSKTLEVDPNVVSYDEYRDPLMPVNRFVFGFNDVVSRYFLVPVGKGYARVVPDPVDNRIEDFFHNVGGPIYAVNNLLQGRPKDSGVNVVRFGINSTLGLLGLFDPAEAWFGLERRKTDFAATLAHHGAGYGVYVVLPFLGPSDLRNAGGRAVDYFMHPVPYVLDNPESSVIIGYGYFHDFAQGADGYESLREKSDDPYIFIRNLHLQKIQRDAAYR